MAETIEGINFLVEIDGVAKSGVSKVSGLRRGCDVLMHRDGEDLNTDRRLPGRATWEPVTIERAVSTDTAFEDWAEEAMGTGGPRPASGYMRNVQIALLDEERNVVVAYNLAGCWPSGYEGLSVLDADGSAIAVERLTLEYASWRRVR